MDARYQRHLRSNLAHPLRQATGRRTSDLYEYHPNPRCRTLPGALASNKNVARDKYDQTRDPARATSIAGPTRRIRLMSARVFICPRYLSSVFSADLDPNPAIDFCLCSGIDFRGRDKMRSRSPHHASPWTPVGNDLNRRRRILTLSS
jgi:hypothetical protein